LKTKIDETKVSRIGAKKADKNRPVLIVMDNRNDVINVVSNWQKLPKHLKVAFDHTLNQREEFKKLKKQADLFNRSHNQDYLQVVKFKQGNPTIVNVLKEKNKSENLSSFNKSLNFRRIPSLDKQKNA